MRTIPPLRPQSVLELGLGAPRERGAGEEIAEHPAGVALIQRHPASEEITRDLRERDALAEMTLADVEGDVEAVDPARQRDPQIPGSVQNQALARAVRPAALVPPNDANDVVHALHVPQRGLVDRQLSPTVRT